MRAGAELGVVVAYGRIIPERILDVLPMVNVPSRSCHAGEGRRRWSERSWRATPTTGVCVMRLEAGLDTGPVLARREVAIGEEETAHDLRERLGVLGAGFSSTSCREVPKDSEPVSRRRARPPTHRRSSRTISSFTSMPLLPSSPA